MSHCSSRLRTVGLRRCEAGVRSVEVVLTIAHACTPRPALRLLFVEEGEVLLQQRVVSEVLAEDDESLHLPFHHTRCARWCCC